MKSPLESVGQSYKDFVITKYLPLDELKSTIVELVHEPTGARVIHIANDDPENLFCLSFQTFPSKSNGVAHILEHTVLCGSKKFPVKDPFFAMTRRSLNTYMNALTGQDFTCYPASSQVEKDFYNLLEVYLDAVFHPELKKVSFLQEGHRLEFVDPQNHKGPLQFQGVVYNEMKGAMSSIQSRLWEALAKELTPDLPYAHNSGGDPKDIPSLTHEELCEFHSSFYHPSRCLFFFYGNLPLSKHLDFIAKHSLHHVKKIPLLPPLPFQPRFKQPVFAEARFPIAQNESLEKKTQIAFAWLTLPISDQAGILTLNLIETLLADNDASPLKMALLKSGLCTQVETSIDAEMSEIPCIIICQGCEEKDATSLREVLFSALREAISRPFAAEEIEASLHQLEFQRLEIGAEGIPFGLTLFMRAALIKQHGSEPEDALLVHSLFNDLRSRLSDPDYIPSFIRKYLLENPHFVQLILKPDPNLEKEEQEEEQKKLAKIRSHLTEPQGNQIAKEMEKLASYQESVEHQSLECLPKVTLADVPPHAKDFPLHLERAKGLEVFHHDCFTNQVLYADLIYDLPKLPKEDLPLVSLFARILPELGCGGRNYAENLAYQQAYIGGIDASLALHVTNDAADACRPTFSLRGKVLHRNADKLFSLFIDFAKSADFSDKERLQEWLEQHATDLQNRFIKNSLSYAIQTALSGFSTASFVYNQWHGLPYYQTILKQVKEFGDLLIEKLKGIQDLILGLEHPQLVLSCSKEQADLLRREDYYGLTRRLPHRSFTPWEGNYELPIVDSHAYLIPAPVAFTAYAMRTVSYQDLQAPFLLISTELMGNLILHKEIREKGGAYGSGASYAPSTGNFNLFSLRDPHLSNTIEIFQQALEKIGSGNFNERELEEAKLGVIQTIDAPVPPGNRAIAAYAWMRAGRTWELRDAFRKKILSATKEEVSDAVQKCLVSKEKTLISFLGQEVLKREESKLKNPLPILPIEI